MEAGLLTERVTIQEDRGTAADAHNSPVENWRPLGTVWAEVRPLTGQEQQLAQQTQAQAQLRVRLRLTSLTRRLTARHRLLWGGRVLYLEPPMFDPRYAEVTVLAKERV